MAAKTNKDQSASETSGETNGMMSDLFFRAEGGTEYVKRMLRDAVRSARQKAKMRRTELDGLCCFEKDGLPKCAEFESNPALMNHQVFCRAAAALGLRIDQVLKIDCSGEKLQAVLRTMTQRNAGLVAALPAGGARKPVADEKVAPMYAAFKILSEL